MTVLVGGMRVLNANYKKSAHGVFTDRPETLTNDFFVNLLDMSLEWKASQSAENVYEGRDREAVPSSGLRRRLTSCSARTRSFEPSRRSTHRTTRRRSSSATSSLRGTRS